MTILQIFMANYGSLSAVPKEKKRKSQEFKVLFSP